MTDTSTELVHVQVPGTGELIPYDAPSPVLADAIDRIRTLERQLAEARAEIGRELIDRMDRNGEWTMHLGTLDATAPSPAAAFTDEWDVEALLDALAFLVSDNLITEAAAKRALKVETVWKPQKRGLDALRKLGPDVAARIDACLTRAPRERRVSVKVVKP